MKILQQQGNAVAPSPRYNRRPRSKPAPQGRKPKKIGRPIGQPRTVTEQKTRLPIGQARTSIPSLAKGIQCPFERRHRRPWAEAWRNPCCKGKSSVWATQLGMCIIDSAVMRQSVSSSLYARVEQKSALALCEKII